MGAIPGRGGRVFLSQFMGMAWARSPAARPRAESEGEENSMGMEVAKRNLSMLSYFAEKRHEIVEIPSWQYRD